MNGISICDASFTLHLPHSAFLLPACSGVWDNITCWRPANVGETVTVPCPKVFSNFYSKAGTVRGLSS